MWPSPSGSHAGWVHTRRASCAAEIAPYIGAPASSSASAEYRGRWVVRLSPSATYTASSLSFRLRGSEPTRDDALPRKDAACSNSTHAVRLWHIRSHTAASGRGGNSIASPSHSTAISAMIATYTIENAAMCRTCPCAPSSYVGSRAEKWCLAVAAAVFFFFSTMAQRAAERLLAN